MKRVAVFCGSSTGSNPVFKEHAVLLGETLAKRKIELVYGGAQVGLMGAVADGALSGGGKVIGVIPEFLQTKEIAHDGLTELISVETMHERKAIEYDLCDGAIALPGGYGTLDEMFELITWGQLGLHPKPVGLLNINGYYDSLIEMVQKMMDEGFIKPVNKDMLLISKEIDQLLDRMMEYSPPDVPKWIKELL